ncbi:MAG: hypothetical protein AAFV72_12030 [Cyanobacteria bacterium J06635_1]
MTIRRFVLMSAFRLSMIWDLLTTFLGTLILLNSISFISLGISLVGTLTVGAFNFATKSIWQARNARGMELILLKSAWILAIAFDFWTSLTCNATYVALGRFEIGGVFDFGALFATLNISQILIVVFVTIIATLGPMLVGYIRDRDLDFLA